MVKNMLELTLQAICIVTLFFVTSGFICYKAGKSDTWEGGVAKVFNVMYNFVYEGATGKTPIVPEKEVDARLYLSSEEMLALTKQLEDVYEQLHLANGIVCTEDIAWFDYSAFSITPKYKHLFLDDRKRLITSIVNKYYQEIRGILHVPIYIKICSEYRLYFAIALNQAGVNYLNKQEQFTTCTDEDFRTEYSSKVIEVTVPEESKDDFRL